MKIFLMTDMEGVCGIINFQDWCAPGARYYEEGRMLLTMEVNAAVQGFFSAGATEIHVADAHGFGGINQLLLDNRTSLIRGFPGRYPFEMDSSYDAIAWVGQHAKAGSEYSHISHTESFKVIDYSINGISVGEFGMIAMCAEFLGVTPIFCSGEEAMAREAANLMKGIETVSVKRGLVPGLGDECTEEEYSRRNFAAMHIHPDKARELIRKGAENALLRYARDRKSFIPLGLKPPFKRTIKYRKSNGNPEYMTYSQHESDLIKMLNSEEVRQTGQHEI